MIALDRIAYLTARGVLRRQVEAPPALALLRYGCLQIGTIDHRHPRVLLVAGHRFGLEPRAQEPRPDNHVGNAPVARGSGGESSQPIHLVVTTKQASTRAGNT